MWLDTEKLKKAVKKRGLSLNQALKVAGVSKTAYYAIISRASLLPESIHALAESLQINPKELLSDGPAEIAKIRRMQAKLERVMRKNPSLDSENVWHTLVMLEMTPIERLSGALRRAVG